MATDKAIDSNVIVLYDRWPGQASVVGDLPADGITNSTDHNVVAATRRYGEKVVVYNMGTAGIAGYATFIYLQVGTQNADFLLVAKSIVVNDSASLWYQMTNDPDDCIAISGGLAAIALSAMTNAYFGFFWCGGICPEDFVAGLAGNYECDGGVTAGGFMAKDLSEDCVGLGVLAAATDVAFGYSLVADG